MKQAVKRMVSKAILLVCLGLGLLSVAGQLAAKVQFRFDNIDVLRGLENTWVTQVLQGRQGYIWIGTQDGLYRFDGYDFKIFRHESEDPNSLAGNDIQHLYQDSKGVLWVSIWRGGFARFDPKKEIFTRYRHDPQNSNSLSNDEVMAITEDKVGNLWIATLGGGLNRYNTNSHTFTHFRYDPQDPDSLSDDKLYTVLQDSQGTIWAGTRNGGLNRLIDKGEKAGKFQHYQHNAEDPKSLSHNKVYTLLEDSHGILWVGTRGGGLNRFDRQTGIFQHYRYDSQNIESLGSDHVFAIFEDKMGTLWVGTAKGGLNRFDPHKQRFDRYQHDPQDKQSLLDNDVFSITQDQIGTIWLGVFGSGISKFDPASARFGDTRHDSNNPNSLNKGSVQAIFKDRSGLLWIGTDTGLSSYNKTTDQYEHYQHDPDNPASLSNNDVYAIFEDSSGVLWVGTNTGGLNRFDRQKNRFTHYRHNRNDPNSLSDDIIQVINEDGAGNLWLGTFNGLNRFNPQADNFDRYTHLAQSTTGISHNYIYALYIAQDGTLWVGTSGGGLNHFNPQTQTFTQYMNDPNNPSSLSHNTVKSIYQDPQGIFWIGTDDGLNKFDPISQQFSQYRDQQGLSGGKIVAMLGDNNGQLWFSTSGISVFDPVTQSIKKHIGKQVGCDPNQGAYFKATDGQLFFGHPKGYCAFYPDEVSHPSLPPKLVLTDFRLINISVPLASQSKKSPLTKVINHTQSLTLTHKDNVLSFEFSALHYVSPKDNQYQYQLQGFDPDWIETAANNRRATYTNLPAGDYTFKVKASNYKGVWTEQARTVKLTIKPAPWFSWWAYLIYTLLLVSLVVAFIRDQQKKLHQQQQKTQDEYALNQRLKQVDRLKDEFLANTSHELRTPLNGIIGLAESLIDGIGGPQSKTSITNLAMVVASGKRLSNLVNDILDFSKLKNRNLTLHSRPVDLYSMAEVVLTLSQPLLGKKDLELVNAIDKDLPAALADENRLEQILHNLVGNAIKFTDAGKVTLSAIEQNNGLIISVNDTGIGIDKSHFVTVFDSFEQVQGHGERSHSGTGLGLAVSKQLVELHGGSITVESEVGKGSTFRFSLPVTDEKPLVDMAVNQAISRLHLLKDDTEAEHTTAPTIQLDGDVVFRILLVDDEPINRQVLNNHLSLKNYHLVEASGGEEALEIIAQSEPFDLILLDIMMPRVSGYEVCSRLRQTYRLHDLPVIFLTAKNQVADMVESFAVGANDYLSKPVSKHELLTRVETHLKFLDIHRNLESKVAGRTAELEQKNREIIDTQQQLVQAEKMASLGTLTAGVAHEINNPTNFVHLSTQNLEVALGEFQQFLLELAGGDEADKDIIDSFDEQFKSLYNPLGIIKNGTRRIKMIVEDLKAFTQLDAAEQNSVQVTDLLQSTINLVQAKYRKVAEFVTDFTDVPELYCYPAQLNQVFMNLIVNACDAIAYDQQQTEPANQPSSHQPGQIIIGCTMKDNAIEITVQDNGCGMTEQTKSKLFEPFYTTKEVGKGTGLGLSISFGIVQKHGGQLSVESELGVGSRFLVKLPCQLNKRKTDGTNA